MLSKIRTKCNNESASKAFLVLIGIIAIIIIMQGMVAGIYNKYFKVEYVTTSTVGIGYGIEDELTELNNDVIIDDSALCNLNDVGIRYKFVDGILMKYHGKYRLTHYCSCSGCCGPYANGITASGRYAQAGVSVAVDISRIPLGKHMYIDGYGKRRADDTGGGIKQNKLDVYVNSHSEAYALGVKNNVDVWVEV